MDCKKHSSKQGDLEAKEYLRKGQAKALKNPQGKPCEGAEIE